jgi:hypothetical protein
VSLKLFGKIALITYLASTCHGAFGQESDDPRGLNHAYAAVIGSGIYFLDDRKLVVLRVPLRKTLSKPEVGRLGAKLLLPLTFAYEDFDSEYFPDNNDSLSGVTFVPGIELQHMLNSAWALKPFAQGGVGWASNNDEVDLIWATGIRTRADVRFATPRISLGAELLYASHNGPQDSNSDSDNFSRFAVGIDIQFPWALKIGERRTTFATHLIGYDYIKDLEFSSELGDPYQIGSSVEVGVALGLDPPLSLMGLSIDRVGLGLRYGDDQKAIILVRKFPF